MRRSFPARLALAGLGMLFLCVASYTAVGWAVFKYRDFFLNTLGVDRYDELLQRYASALGTLLPADGDGDGVSNSVERYLRTDPQNPASCPVIAVNLEEERGFTATALEYRSETPDILVIPGERCRLRLPVRTRPRIPFARGMQLQLTPSGRGLLCLPGGTPAGDSLLVPVSTNGVMEFDFLFPRDAMKSDTIQNCTAIYATHPTSRTPAGVPLVTAARRLSPLPCTVQDLPPSDPARILVTQDGGDQLAGFSFVRLTWQPNGISNLYFVEASRDETGWFPIAYRRTNEGHCELAYKLTNSHTRHHGPLHFRIVPAEPLSMRN